MHLTVVARRLDVNRRGGCPRECPRARARSSSSFSRRSNRPGADGCGRIATDSSQPGSDPGIWNTFVWDGPAVERKSRFRHNQGQTLEFGTRSSGTVRLWNESHGFVTTRVRPWNLEHVRLGRSGCGTKVTVSSQPGSDPGIWNASKSAR